MINSSCLMTNDTHPLPIGNIGAIASPTDQSGERDNAMSTLPKAFRNPRADDKVQLILDFILQHPDLARSEVLSWATDNLGIARHTAEIYFRQAQKRYLADQERCAKCNDPLPAQLAITIDSRR